MGIIEIVAIIGLVLRAIQFGISLGKKAKNNRRSPQNLAIIF